MGPGSPGRLKSETEQTQVPLGEAEAGSCSLAACMEPRPCSYPGAD